MLVAAVAVVAHGQAHGHWQGWHAELMSQVSQHVPLCSAIVAATAAGYFDSVRLR